jgi:hypothetical protein
LFAVVDNLRRVSFSGKQQRQAVAAFLGNRGPALEIGMRMLLANNSLHRVAKYVTALSAPKTLPVATSGDVSAVPRRLNHHRPQAGVEIKKGRDETVAAFQ